MNLSLVTLDCRILQRHRATVRQDAPVRVSFARSLLARLLPLLGALHRVVGRRMAAARNPVPEVVRPATAVLASASETLARWAVRIVLASRPKTPQPL
jgi:hypothetical protein